MKNNIELKEYDSVELIVDRECYAKDGVYKGMQGWICFDECSDGYWLVNFPQYGAKKDIATISVNEDDLKLIPKMDARVNERIKAQFEDSENTVKAFNDKPDDISGYLI